MNTDASADQTARDFLSRLYGDPDTVNRIWTCGFANFPGNWTGAHGVDHLKRLSVDRANFYFCIGEMDPAAQRRSNDDVIAQHLIIADDIGTKADRGVWDMMLSVGFPAPTFRIETSPGNETWGWRLDVPVKADDLHGWQDVAVIRAWLTAKNLTDPGVADPARYIRLPLGWNSKDKYVSADGTAPAVTLQEFDPSRTVTLDAFGAALLGVDAWRSVPLPPAAMNASMLSRSGAVNRCADLNNPEPLMRLWEEMGGQLRQARGGVVEALCPNIADHTHDGREGTGFAFLGNGLMECTHGHCQHLSTPGFKGMMMDQFDAWAGQRHALGMDVPLGAQDARHFLTLADLEARGALDPAAIESVKDEASALAARQADHDAGVAEDRERKLAALAHRFVWLHDQMVFADIRDRTLHTPKQITIHADVVPVIEAGTTGKKSADNVLYNHPGRRNALGVIYRPGDTNAMVDAEDVKGRFGPHINVWRPSGVGRQPGTPQKWLDVLTHLLPDKDYREWLIDWFAWVIQNPASRTPIIPIVVSGQGAGKDTILKPIFTIMGAHNYDILSPQAVMSPFNDWVRKRFLYLEEVKLDANGRAYNKIKSLTGAAQGVRVTVNEKFVRGYQIEFMGVFIAMTNEASALQGMEHDDRRFAPYISPAPRLETIWTPADHNVLNSVAEVERVHDFLLTRDIKAFNPFTPPVDTSGARQEVLTSSLPEPAAEAFNLLTSGELKDRRVFAFSEVMATLSTHQNPNVRNHLTHSVVRRGLLAAGCQPCHGGKLVRVGEETLRLWVGPSVPEAEADRLTGKDKANIPAPKDLAQAFLDDRDAAAKAREKALLGSGL